MKNLFHLENEESYTLECMETAEGTCQSPLHTPGWVRWEELFKTEGGKNGLGYSNKKVVVRLFGSTILAERRLFRIYIDIKNQVIFQGIFR